jgi:hypothetical protein
MIAVTAAMRVRVAVEPVDFRRGMDGLARVCREVLSVDPFSGALFLFRNRRGTALKLLAYDGQGFWLCQNQLSSHYTSFDSRQGPWLRDCDSRRAARSVSRSQRLECFVGGSVGSS